MSSSEEVHGRDGTLDVGPDPTDEPRSERRTVLPVPVTVPVKRDQIYLGTSIADYPKPCYLQLSRANRHGLIAGQTGTGKTVTLQVLVEGFVRAGVPVVVTDVKGDLAGLSRPGTLTPEARQRWDQLQLPPEILDGLPVTFWDVFGAAGLPMRLTVAGMGPTSLSRLLNLSEAQEGVLAVAFRLAQDVGLPLVDFDDLRAILVWMHGNAERFAMAHGAVAPQSIATLQRKLIAMEVEGFAEIFGNPAFELEDLLEPTGSGAARVNILTAERLIRAPRLYGAVLISLLTCLQDRLPEVGDEDAPRLVVFFEEAHLLFRNAPKLLMEKLEQTVRLIRSKGVGIYFVTQSPNDIPGSVLGQLGNRVLHAMRGYTPRDQKGLRAAAESFRTNPAFETAAVLPDMGVGEALVSTLGVTGEPAVVQRVRIRPPGTRLGAIKDTARQDIIASSPLLHKYGCGTHHDARFDHFPLQLDRVFGSAPSESAESSQQPEASINRGLVPVKASSDLLPRRVHLALVAWIDEAALRNRIADGARLLGRRTARALFRPRSNQNPPENRVNRENDIPF